MSHKKKYTLAFSPCPNDTFMFHAMVYKLIDTEGLEFDFEFEDIEALNNVAFEEKFDITKMSFNAFGYLSDKYVLLNSGAALGRGCGPLLISKSDRFYKKPSEYKIAIPGIYTTANLLLNLMWPEVNNKLPVLFSNIEDAIINDEVDAGLIIHENRFTYQKKGLHKICDLGEWWENSTGMPIPLGGIAVKRCISDEDKKRISRVLSRSIRYAFDNPDASKNFIQEHASEIDDNVTSEHIKLYVNKFSLNLGDEGKNAIRTLYSKALEVKRYKVMHGKLFV